MRPFLNRAAKTRKHDQRLQQAPTTLPADHLDSQLVAPSPNVKVNERLQRLVQEEAQAVHTRLLRRAQYLAGKASRLPIDSNGRQRSEAERLVLLSLVAHLEGKG